MKHLTQTTVHRTAVKAFRVAPLIALCACNQITPDNDDDQATTSDDIEEVGESTSSLYYESGSVFSGNTISVCWKPTDTWSTEHRGWVRSAVEGAFENLIDIDFTGWATCTGAGANIVIDYDGSYWPSSFPAHQTASTTVTTKLNFFTGGTNPGGTIGANFGPCFSYSPAIGPTGKAYDTAQQWCVKTLAVHEFAHTLAVAHEQNRTADTPTWCTESNDGWGDTAYGYWDATSISNYCNVWNGDGMLSPLDVAGLRFLYGNPHDDYMWRGVGNFRNYSGKNWDQLMFETQYLGTKTGSYSMIPGDYNGDENDDIFFYGTGSTTGDAIWQFDDNMNLTNIPQSVASGMVLVSGDFDIDGCTDLFRYNPAGADALMLSNCNGTFTEVAKTMGSGVQPIAGDFDGNGAADIFWYGPGSTADSMWLFSGLGTGNHSVVSQTVIGTGYVPFSGDFDNDGYADLFLYAPGSAADGVWFGSPSGSFTAVSVTSSGNYHPMVQDFDGNGTDDILWDASGTEPDAIWLGNTNRTFTGSYVAYHETSNGVAGDFNDDGKGDVFWQK